MVEFKHFILQGGVQLRNSVFILLLAWSNSTWANAESEKIQELIAQGKLQQALSETNRQLDDDSKNITFRFLKGLILTKTEQLNDARDIFLELTKEHPDLPEPYNNLAVIYAAQGEFDRAREALQQAINTHPSYATAHENMGDIYAKMAVIAYSEALQLDSENKTAREKLSLVSEMFSVKVKEQLDIANARQAEAEKSMAELNRLEKQLDEAERRARDEQEKASQTKSELITLEQNSREAVEKAKMDQLNAEQRAKEALAKVEEARAELSRIEKMKNQTAEQARVEQQKAEEAAKIALAKVEEARSELSTLESQREELKQQITTTRQESDAQAKLAQSKVEEAKMELARLEQEKLELANKKKLELAELEQQKTKTTTQSRDSSLDSLLMKEVTASVKRWSERWSAQDVTGYLSAYAENFTPAKGMAITEWQQQRSGRLTRPKFINIELRNIDVKILGVDHAQVKFLQKYQSDTYSDLGRKTLLLKKIDGEWLIIEEIAGR